MNLLSIGLWFRYAPRNRLMPVAVSFCALAIVAGSPAQAGSIAVSGNQTMSQSAFRLHLPQIVDPPVLVNLTNTSAKEKYASWSPDGRKIAYISDRDGNDELYVMDADGSNVIQLAHELSTTWNARRAPIWSPDGGRIAFAQTLVQNSCASNSNDDPVATIPTVRILVVNANGDNLRVLRDGADLPQWSPDGSRILFTSSYCCYLTSLWVMDADGSNVTPISSSILSSQWSPDGNKILFSSYSVGKDEIVKFEIYLMDADGSHVTNLTDSSTNMNAPQWSPDGSKIAFLSCINAGCAFIGLHVMDVDGSHQRMLFDEFFFSTVPMWSPDGSKIAFAAKQGLEGAVMDYVVNGDGSYLVSVASIHPYYGYELMMWSPNRNVLAYINDDDLFVASFD